MHTLILNPICALIRSLSKDLLIFSSRLNWLFLYFDFKLSLSLSPNFNRLGWNFSGFAYKSGVFATWDIWLISKLVDLFIFDKSMDDAIKLCRLTWRIKWHISFTLYWIVDIALILIIIHHFTSLPVSLNCIMILVCWFIVKTAILRVI